MQGSQILLYYRRLYRELSHWVSFSLCSWTCICANFLNLQTDKLPTLRDSVSALSLDAMYISQRSHCGNRFRLTIDGFRAGMRRASILQLRIGRLRLTYRRNRGSRQDRHAYRDGNFDFNSTNFDDHDYGSLYDDSCYCDYHFYHHLVHRSSEMCFVPSCKPKFSRLRIFAILD